MPTSTSSGASPCTPASPRQSSCTFSVQGAHAPAHGADAGAELDWFAHDPVAGARAGRQAAEFWRGAVAHLREALALRPAATELSYVLAQASALGHPNQRAASWRLVAEQRRDCLATSRQHHRVNGAGAE